MKSRFSLIFAALVVLLGSMVWMVQDRRTVGGPPEAPAARLMVSAPFRTVEPAPLAAEAAEPTTLAVAPLPAAALPVAASVETPSAAAPATTQPEPRKATPTVRVDAGGAVTYVARSGDTVAELAGALLGGGSQEHRDAVIDANPSLQDNPDRVLAGQTYSIVPSPDADEAGAVQTPDTATPAAPRAPEADAADAKPAVDGKTGTTPAGPKLKYLAQAGDTVRVLASNLLGGDTKANRDTIIASNASLQQDPDHLVAGKNYTIVARNGLAADPAARPPAAPTSRPNADDILKLGVGRSLRYTAKPGDTVSKLAIVLLGSNTRENRESIIKNNPALKHDRDHLVAGETYWITAPTAD